MKRHPPAIKLWLTIMSLPVLVIGCAAQPESSSIPRNAVFTPTSSANSVQRITSPPMPISTALPTATLVPTQPPTTFPLPTLSADEAQAVMLDLFWNNGGCRLPCWWGITPGRTSWETAQRFLATFAFAIKQGGSLEYPLYSVYFIVPKEVDPNAEEPHPIALTHNYHVIKEIVEVIEVDPGLVSSYKLSEFLKAYGSPAEVWLRTYSQAREGDLEFDVVLFYPQQGLLARYATQAQAVGSVIRACPQKEPMAIMALWSPRRVLAFSDATSQTINIRDEADWRYRPLQEVTQLDIEAFHTAFQNPANPTCLETPAELWPPP